jgi:hypothetical protein
MVKRELAVGVGDVRRAQRRTQEHAPGHVLALHHWAARSGRTLSSPVTLADFLEYGNWFQRQAVPELDRRLVRSVASSRAGLRLQLDDGQELTAGRVAVAAGLAPFPRVPEAFRGISPALWSHSTAHRDFAPFRDKRVAVVGAGQSALESAALLHEAGSQVELIGRASAIWWLTGPVAASSASTSRRRTWRSVPWSNAPTDVGGPLSSWLVASPDVFRRLPKRLQPGLAYRCIRPAGAHWLPDRLAEVPMTLDRSVTSLAPDGRLGLTLSDGSRREVDHLVVATGFDIDVRRYPFLDAGLAAAISVRSGYPVLGPGLESSVPGLHFLGAAAALSFGPVMRFVTGSWYAAPSLASRVLGRRQRPLRWSF